MMKRILVWLSGVLFLSVCGDAGTLHSDELSANTSARQNVSVTPRALTGSGPLRVLASNPRYFTDDTGKAIYLVGSHTWSNGMEDRGTINPPLPFNYDNYIDFMVAHNFNWMRLWTTETAQASVSDDPDENIISGPYKWRRTGPGNANDGGLKFDLTQLDQAYFDRMRAHVIQAGQNGIYVAVQLFNGYMFQFDLNSQDGNPFESANNINGIDCDAVCPTDNSQIPSAVWSIEQAYFRKVIDTVNDLDNVMYEVSNEAGSPYSDSWQASVISYVKTYEATKPFQHPVGMTFQYTGGNDSTLYDSEADWVSPSAQLPLATGNKVVINDTDHSYSWNQLKSDGQAAQRAWAWKNFLSGNNTGFMDPYLVVWSGRNAPGGATSDPKVGATVDPYWNVLRNAMRDTQTYAARINLAAMTPQPSLSSTGYCLANAGHEYLVYRPSGGGFRVNLSAQGNYTVEWFNPTTGVIAQTGTAFFSSGNQTFTPPFSGNSVLYLKIGAPDTTPPSVPSNLTATAISSSQINLAWRASTDNVGVAGYRVFRNGSQIASTTQLSRADTGRSPSTTYSYTVAAFDGSGNLSAQSAAVPATTQDAPPPDTTPPTVSLTSPSDGEVVNSTVTVAANASDNVAVVGVQFKLDGANLGAEDAAAPYSVSWDTTTASNGTHTISAVARDAAGNTSTATASVTVDNSPPPIAVVQSRSVDCGTTTSCSLAFTSNNTPGNLLVIGIRVGDVNQTVAVTDSGGNSYSFINRKADSEGDEAFLFYAPDSKAGSNQVTISINGAAATLRFAIHEFHGVTALDQTASATGTSSTVNSGNVTTTNASELIFGFAMGGNSDIWTAGSGYTVRETPSGKACSEYKIASTTQAANATFTVSPGDTWSAIVATFR
jgi:chitodextrinase